MAVSSASLDEKGWGGGHPGWSYRVGKVSVEHPGPLVFYIKGESLIHPVTLPNKPLLPSEGDNDVERKVMMLLRRARSQGVFESQSGRGLTSGADDKNLDTASLKTFPDPRGGHAAAGTKAGVLLGRLGIGCRTRRSFDMEMRSEHLLDCAS